MARIFHQNMRVYGGGAAGRNAAYTAAFGAIQGATAQDYIVAGFTEVTNANANLRGTLSGLAQVLDPGLTGFVVIEVGTTALGLTEYIGIAWDPTYVTVQHAGQVLWHSVNRVWQPYSTPAAAIANQRVLLPGGLGLGADSRGLAYIAATYNGANYLFGFMHNMYALGNRSGAYTSLNVMADNARQLIGGAYAGAEVIIGGDFNLEPRPPKRRRGATFVLHARATRAGLVYVNTTAAHPYDYWVVSRLAITDANAEVHVQTRVPLASDHAAIALNR